MWRERSGGLGPVPRIVARGRSGPERALLCSSERFHGSLSDSEVFSHLIVSHAGVGVNGRLPR